MPALLSFSVSALRLAVFLVFTIIAIPIYALVMVAHGPYRVLARLYWRVCARIMGMEIRLHGERMSHKPGLFVANHASYLDIVVLGSLLDAAFVAKQEVGTWPGISIIAKLGRTVFVKRQRSESARERDVIAQRLESGESLILFPEGTSSDGNRALPFKSALFSVAERCPNGQPLMVQPVTVAYTRLDNMPIGMLWRPFFAWYGDMELAPHIWQVMGLGNLTIDVVFHAPATIAEFGSRKVMADYCQRQVARGLALANSGRLPPGGEAPVPATPPPVAPPAVSPNDGAPQPA